MQAAPPQADPPKRQRRWFQFSLRTLLIVVTLLAIPCGWVGWQAKIVRARITEVEQRSGANLDAGIAIETHGYGLPSIPWLRRLIGDVKVYLIVVDPDAPKDQVDRLRSLFPEARFLTDDLLHPPREFPQPTASQPAESTEL